jgi:hypothetical protein
MVNTYDYIKDNPQFLLEAQGKIEAMGLGEIEMYFVSKIPVIHSIVS